ncbi:MAG TPA: hypothetical protein VHC18_23100 [Amycolatopsis sp.]|nr:hypothetical protein [Amycolatopsis sp.]
MSTFDSGQYDIPTLIGKLRDQRFDGYGSEALAQEVEKFRDGGGTASMGDAVDALKQIATALAQTDKTLRDQLGAMGVHWQSAASGQASAVLAQQAGFSDDANSKVSAAAQLIFEQGEAFNRTKNKLPDPDALRQTDGGYTLGDTLFSLFGFETDHAKDVRAGLEARAQAVDALNAYAHDSGNYLASSEEVAEPDSLDVATGAGPDAVLAGAGAAQTLAAPAPDISPTQAASAKDSFPVAQSPAPQPRHAPVTDVATPPMGIPARQTGSAGSAPAAAQHTAPSSATAPAAAPASAPVLSNGPVRTGSGYPHDTVRPAPVQGTPNSPTFAPGQQAPGVVNVPQTGDGQQQPGRSTAWGKPGTPAAGGGGLPADGRGLPVDGGARGGAPQPGESVLGKGKLFGAGPGAAAGSTNVGPGFALKGAPGGGAQAEGVPAIGAAAAGGAVGGDGEDRARRQGQNASKRTQQLPVGDLPEEAEAQGAKKAAPQPPSRERTRAILEPAATQDGDEDAEHVRRFGIDDKDLFTDPREVSPDLIGGDPLPEDR